MRRLVGPPGGEVALEDLYARLAFPDAGDRPVVYLGMVASLDGVVTVDGVSGALGGEADQRAFRALRAAADAVLAGAGTVRAEDYRGVRLPADVRARREAAGQDPVPPVVVVSAGLDLDPQARVFQDTSRPPWLLVPEDADPDRLAPLAPHARVVRAGRGRVDLALGVRQLRQLGVRRLLVEGGPSLNAQLLRAGLVDEVFLTLAPHLLGEGRRLFDGPVGGQRAVELLEVHEHEGELLLRLRVVARA